MNDFQQRLRRLMETAASRTRYFIRFGEPPRGGKSKLWTAPNIYYRSQEGSDLPGMSVYAVTKVGNKWNIETDSIKMHGMTSLAELLYRHVVNRKLPIYLLKGRALRWHDIPKEERHQFDDYYPGDAASARRYDLEGTDGEPLLRDYTIVGKLDVTQLINEASGFPEDYEDELRNRK